MVVELLVLVSQVTNDKRQPFSAFPQLNLEFSSCIGLAFGK